MIKEFIRRRTRPAPAGDILANYPQVTTLFKPKIIVSEQST
jgi:hypothetical protein